MWSILNHLDNSEIEYSQYLYLHDDAYSPISHQIIDYNLNVYGKIPKDCDGVIFKIGPNPRWKKNVGIKYNWFDGDGMVHAIKLISDNNTAHYSNMYINTTKYYIESKYNRSIYFNMFGSSHANGIIGFIKFLFGAFNAECEYSPLSMDNYRENPGNKFGERGEANTAVLSWNNKLFALNEAAQPFEFKYNSKTAQLINIGYYNFNNSWNMAFTAHPKIDQDKHQLFTHGAYLQQMGEVIVGMTDSQNPNILIKSKRIKLNAPQIMHDMMVTENYIILLDTNAHFGQDTFIDTNFQRIFAMNKNINARIGIMDRSKLSLSNMNQSVDIQWFDIKPCVIFHLANGWEENKDEMIIIGNRFEEFDLNNFQITFNINLQEIDEYIKYHHIYKWTINLNDGLVQEGPMNVGRLYNDGYIPVMPVINPQFKGKKNRYMFAVLAKDFFDETRYNRRFVGILKYDFEKERVVNKILFDDKQNDNGNTEFMIIRKHNGYDEDDVYIASLIYNYERKRSRLEIYDGKSMNHTSVATVMLNTKVPVAFHGLFVHQNEMDEMDEIF